MTTHLTTTPGHRRTITDRRGAVWPVTEFWCDGCGFPLWWDAPDKLHPGCVPDVDPTPTETATAIVAAVDQLGAHVLPADPPLGTWAISGEQVGR